MRTDIPAALQSHLDSQQTTLAWCWKITRRDTNWEDFGSPRFDRLTGVTYPGDTPAGVIEDDALDWITWTTSPTPTVTRESVDTSPTGGATIVKSFKTSDFRLSDADIDAGLIDLDISMDQLWHWGGASLRIRVFGLADNAGSPDWSFPHPFSPSIFDVTSSTTSSVTTNTTSGTGTLPAGTRWLQMQIMIVDGIVADNWSPNFVVNDVSENNTVLGFTNHDRDLTFDGVVYEASTGFLGTDIESQLGMTVDNLDIFGALNSDNITEADIKAGRYDNAGVSMYLVNWADVTQRVIMKKGNLGNVRRGKTLFETEVRGISHEMQQVQGRLYSYKCDAKLSDGQCTQDLIGSTYTGNGVVTTTDGISYVIASGLGSYSSGWFDRGKIHMTSGANNGLSREVKVHVSSQGVVTINVWEAFPFSIVATDTFSIVAGCDKLFKTCKTKFDNALNFRGFPHVPGVSTAQTYVNRGDPNMDGGGNFLGKD